MYHPVLFTHNIPYDTPVGLKLAQKNIVVWRSGNGRIQCFEDRCPHRGAQLSTGKLLEDRIQCGYHGWEFDKDGFCQRIPQTKTDSQYIPRICDVKTYDTIAYSDILWANIGNVYIPWNTEFCDPVMSFNEKEHFVTDYHLHANYGFLLQIENLLDPAHIHFVHDGFQGDNAKAKYIRVLDLRVDEKKMEATFSHDDPLIPDIKITYYMPSIVEVSIYDKKGRVVRKNIIYVTPVEPGKCSVLFRDVAYKKYLTPAVPTLTRLLNRNFVKESYQAINQNVIDQIMDQDIHILESQQTNVGTSVKDYLQYRPVLITESDALILEFRKWCNKNKSLMKNLVDNKVSRCSEL